MAKKRLFPRITTSVCGFIVLAGGLALAGEPKILKVGRLLVGDGTSIPNAVLVINKGKIEFVGQSYPQGRDKDVVEFKSAWATPGFIAANSYLKISKQVREVETFTRLGSGTVRRKIPALNEERSESTPEMNLFYSIDPRSPDFDRAWRTGVTCVYVAPGNLNVYNGTGTVIKTKGDSLLDMLVQNEVQLKVTLGPDPAAGAGRTFDLRHRRPQNRMGVDYILRDELMTVQNKSDVPDRELSPQERIFRKVLKKEVLLRIRARSYMDIKAALRMMAEFGYQWILEEGTDAYLYLDDLKKNNIPVIYGPVYKIKGRSDFNIESDSYRAFTPLLLARRGILFAFQNGEQSPISSLRDESIFAVQLGLDKETALKALTLNAAKILGVDSRLGTIERGKDADILIFSGDPFEPSSRLEGVMIGGRLFFPDK